MGSVSASNLRVKFNRHLAFMWSVRLTKESDEEVWLKNAGISHLD